MKDKKLEEAIDYVCSCCPYIFSDSAEWDKSNPAFADWRETLYGGDGRDWLIVGIAGAWSYDVYGLHVAHDGKKEKKPLRAEWLVHELTDAGEEV